MERKLRIDIFSCVALLMIASSIFIFYKYYFGRDFITFTTEEQIAEEVVAQFPSFAEYLFADYL